MNDLWHIVQANSNFSSKELKVYIKPYVFEYAILTAGSNSQVNTSMRIKRLKESKQGRMADALALGGDEGRDKLR